MAVVETVLQHWVLTEFVYPFILAFFIIYAVLQTTKVLGAKQQIDAIVAFVIGLIFVAVAEPKLIVSNLILFFVVAMIVVFVVMLLWGFLVQGEVKGLGEGKIKWVTGGVVLVATAIGFLWASGVENDAFDFLFRSSWSEGFWVNFIFIVFVAIALAVALRKNS